MKHYIIVAAISCLVISIGVISLTGSVSQQSRFLSEISEKEQAYLNFIIKYGKSYASNHDYKRRFEIFSAAYDDMIYHNSKKTLFKKGINRFSDLTAEEFSSQYLKGIDL